MVNAGTKCQDPELFPFNEEMEEKKNAKWFQFTDTAFPSSLLDDDIDGCIYPYIYIYIYIRNKWGQWQLR